MAPKQQVALAVLGVAAMTTVIGLLANAPAARAGHSRPAPRAAATAAIGAASTGAPTVAVEPSSPTTPAGFRAPSTATAPAESGPDAADPTAADPTAADPTAAGQDAGVGCPAPSGVVRQAPGTGLTVSLTFDDGPGPDTPALLEVLRRHDVHATFFVIGGNAAARPDLVAQEAVDGNLVGNHTWHHTYPQRLRGGWTASYLHRELTSTAGVITAADHAPVCWFRPPGGNLPATVLPAARALGMSVALWSVDPKDWKLQDHPASGTTATEAVSDQIYQRVAAGIDQPHPLILMHDGGGSRAAGVAAVGRIIDLYQAHGYRFVRLDGQA